MREFVKRMIVWVTLDCDVIQLVGRRTQLCLFADCHDKSGSLSVTQLETFGDVKNINLCASFEGTIKESDPIGSRERVQVVKKLLQESQSLRISCCRDAQKKTAENLSLAFETKL